MRDLMMSGWCAHPSSGDKAESHERCAGWNDANPDKEVVPCPCSCHLHTDAFECEDCGGELRESRVFTDNDPDAGWDGGEDVPIGAMLVHVTARAGGSTRSARRSGEQERRHRAEPGDRPAR